jgi:hypothetical protein
MLHELRVVALGALLTVRFPSALIGTLTLQFPP